MINSTILPLTLASVLAFPRPTYVMPNADDPAYYPNGTPVAYNFEGEVFSASAASYAMWNGPAYR